MKKVFVTEGGDFDRHGFFNGSGVIGVDSDPKEAVRYPIKMGCYRYRVYNHPSGLIIVYKSPYFSRGYRVTEINAY